MDTSEFAQLGAELVEKGSKLKELKKAREDLDKEIEELENEIRPLLTEHSKFIAELVSPAAPPPPPPPPPGQEPHVEVSNGNGGLTDDLRAKIKKYADTRADPETGISAGEVADALKIDPVLVRQAMGEMVRGRR